MKTTNNLQNKSTEDLINLVALLEQKIEQQSSYIKQLHEELQLAKLRHYGRKSEKDLGGAVQLGLFDEAITPDNVDEIEEAEVNIIVPAHNRKKVGRKPLPENLPRVQQIHDIAEEDKICHCGCTLSKIGQDKTEQLDIIPAKVQVIEHIKLKYACKSCGENIITAKTPKQPIPGSIASSGLLAYTLTAKFKDHLPLYRQESIFKRMGVDIARNTLSHWVIKSGELLLPLYKLLQDNIINYDIAFADETRLQVLKEENKDPTTKSYMWCFIGGSPEKRSILYRYDPGRAHTVIEDTLEDFTGYLHCDGYGCYDTYAVDHNVLLVACWAHARRKFVEITKAVKSKGLAHKFVKLIGKLYTVETKCRNNNFTPEQIKQTRQEQAKPEIEKILSLLQDSANKILPKSALGKAIQYCLNQWPKLIKYLDDGRLDIDNNRTERAIKPFVIGRKNWMFSNSVAGAKAGEIIYSLIETCAAHQVEPYAYLRAVLANITAADTLEKLEELTPYNISKELLSY